MGGRLLEWPADATLDEVAITIGGEITRQGNHAAGMGRNAAAVNLKSLQNLNATLASLLKPRRIVMTIYPVPTVVTEARIQLAVDQEANAPPATINNDVAEVAGVQAEAEHEQLLDLKV